METKVSSGAQPKRVGRWTLAQLRQTDGIIPSQAGWNKGDSQKLMTNFGTPRNTSTRVKAENLQVHKFFFNKYIFCNIVRMKNLINV